MYVTSATEVDVSSASYTATTTEVDNVVERKKMKNRGEITGERFEQNVNRAIAIMQQQLVRGVTGGRLMDAFCRNTTFAE